MKNKLFGKNIVWLGSSVTYGHANGGRSMVEYLAENTGANCAKYALSGTTLANIDENSYVARLERMPKGQKCDFFICQLSTNDATKCIPLGTPDDERTVIGAIYRVIAIVRERYDCPVAFYTNPRYASSAYTEMVDAMREISKKEGVLLLDLWDTAAPDDCMADPIHPNERGYRDFLAPIFEQFVSDEL